MDNLIIKISAIMLLSSILCGQFINPHRLLPPLVNKDNSPYSSNCSEQTQLYLEKNYLYAYAFHINNPSLALAILNDIEALLQLCLSELPHFKNRLFPFQQKLSKILEPRL